MNSLDLQTENIFLSLLFTFVSANLAVTAGSARTSVNILKNVYGSCEGSGWL